MQSPQVSTAEPPAAEANFCSKGIIVRKHEKISRKLRIGVFFNARRSQGGLFQYAVATFVALQLAFTPLTGFASVFALDASDGALPAPTVEDWNFIRLKRRRLLPRWAAEWAVMQMGRVGMPFVPRIIPEYSELKRFRPDVTLFLKPDIRVSMWSAPGIVPIHDLQHRLQPRFPEVSASGEANRRELVYRNIAKNAAGVLVDSDVGKEDAVSLYNISPDIVHPLPYFTPSYIRENDTPQAIIRVSEKYPLPRRFFFYPAAFWEHKNHACILRAAAHFRSLGQPVPDVVFAGSRSRGYESLKSLAGELGILDSVHFLGYVPDEDMSALYRLSQALVMPTYFGPTNIPVIEAWACECPVISSDIRGIREQIGDAGLVVNPDDPVGLSAAMSRIMGDSTLKSRLVENGLAKERAWQAPQFGERLWKILLDVASKTASERNLQT